MQFDFIGSFVLTENNEFWKMWILKIIVFTKKRGKQATGRQSEEGSSFFVPICDTYLKLSGINISSWKEMHILFSNKV